MCILLYVTVIAWEHLTAPRALVSCVGSQKQQIITPPQWSCSRSHCTQHSCSIHWLRPTAKVCTPLRVKVSPFDKLAANIIIYVYTKPTLVISESLHHNAQGTYFRCKLIQHRGLAHIRTVCMWIYIYALTCRIHSSLLLVWNMGAIPPSWCLWTAHPMYRIQPAEKPLLTTNVRT